MEIVTSMKPQLLVNANHKPQLIRMGIPSNNAQSWKRSDAVKPMPIQKIGS